MRFFMSSDKLDPHEETSDVKLEAPKQPATTVILFVVYQLAEPGLRSRGTHQGSCLVRADACGVSHRFARPKNPDQVILLEKAGCGEGECECYSEREPLWYCDCNKRNGDDQEVDECRCLLLCRPVVFREIGAEAEQEDEEHER